MNAQTPMIPQHELRYQQLVKDIIPSIKAHQPVNQVVGWVVESMKLGKQYGFTTTELRKAISDLAWYERSLGSRLPSLIKFSSYLESLEPDYVLAIYWYVSQRLRFDFQFNKIIDASTHWLPFGRDTQLDSILIFAFLGLNRPEADELITKLLTDRAKQLDSVAKDILLHGLWFGAERYFEQLIKLSDLMIMNKEITPNVYFRRAVAMRLAGRYPEARESIISAIELTPSGDIDSIQNYIDELELIRTFQVFSSRIAEAMAGLKSGSITTGQAQNDLPTVEELLGLNGKLKPTAPKRRPLDS